MPCVTEELQAAGNGMCGCIDAPGQSHSPHPSHYVFKSKQSKQDMLHLRYACTTHPRIPGQFAWVGATQVVHANGYSSSIATLIYSVNALRVPHASMFLLVLVTVIPSGMLRNSGMKRFQYSCKK